MLETTSCPPLGKTHGVKASLNRTLLQAQQHKMKLRTYERFQGDHFEEVMRKHALNPKALQMELHVQRFADVREPRSKEGCQLPLLRAS
jgi:hypothetical protein